MIEHRDFLRSVALGAALTASQSVSACRLVAYDDDYWGEKLISFFRSGNEPDLDGLFRDFSTLVTFNDSFGVGSALHFADAKGVKSELISVRKSMTRKGWVEPRRLVGSEIVGSRQQGRMNRIELLFAEGQLSETNCGPDRSEIRVDLYFQAGVYEAGDDWVKWGVERLALMPPLEIERFNG